MLLLPLRAVRKQFLTAFPCGALLDDEELSGAAEDGGREFPSAQCHSDCVGPAAENLVSWVT